MTALGDGALRAHTVMVSCQSLHAATLSSGHQQKDNKGTRRGQPEDKKRTTRGQEKTKNKKRTSTSLETGWQPWPSSRQQEDNRRIRKCQEQGKRRTTGRQGEDKSKTTGRQEEDKMRKKERKRNNERTVGRDRMRSQAAHQEKETNIHDP